MRVIPCALVLFGLLAAVPVHAQTPSFLVGAARLGERDAPRISRDVAIDASVEGSFFSDTVLWAVGDALPVRSITGAFSARARIGPVGLEIDVPAQQGDVPFLVYDPYGALRFAPSHTAIGNVNASVLGVADLDFGRAQLTLRAGLGLAAPSSDVPSSWRQPSLAQTDVNEVYALGYGFNTARAQSGQWQDYRFSLAYGDRWTVFAPFGGEMWIDRLGYLAAEGILSVQVGSRGFVSSGLALAVEGGVEPVSFLRVSVRVLGYGQLARASGVDSWWGLPLSTDDFQTSIEPRVTLAYGPIFGRIGFLLNLDRPWGIAESHTPLITYTVWSVRGTAGVRF